MEIYLIRHGIALERGVLAQDEDRPLTNKGTEKTIQVARRLAQQGLQFDLICHSPLLRAQQTAEILKAENLGDRLWETTTLAPDGNIQDWIEQWRQLSIAEENTRVALVGHQPNLGLWAEQWVWGQESNKIVLKKAGIIGIDFSDRSLKLGSGELFVLVSPKWLF
jgi:phosphohistidine phosphatase